MSDTSDMPDVEPDRWTRFDLWAERAHQAAQAAIAVEEGRSDPTIECTSALADVHNRAADIYRDLAATSAPGDAALERPAEICVHR